MARYVSGDLSDVARRRVGRYIDECDDCYREYQRHRDITLQLESKLPALGRPGMDKLDQVWARLQVELAAPGESRARQESYQAPVGMGFSYGLLAVAIAIALLVPLMIGYQASLVTLELPRIPQVAGIAHTPGNGAADRPLLFSTAHFSPRRNTALLQNTPEPRY